MLAKEEVGNLDVVLVNAIRHFEFAFGVAFDDSVESDSPVITEPDGSRRARTCLSDSMAWMACCLDRCVRSGTW